MEDISNRYRKNSISGNNGQISELKTKTTKVSKCKEFGIFNKKKLFFLVIRNSSSIHNYHCVSSVSSIVN